MTEQTDLADFAPAPMPPQRSRRAWLARGGIAAVTLVVSAALAVALIGPNTITATWQRWFPPVIRPTLTTIAGTQPRVSGTWTQLTLAIGGRHFIAWDVAPDDPNTIYGCVDGNSWYRTRDSGVTWQQLHLPVIANVGGCQVQIARDDARRVLFVASPDTSEMAAYQNMTFFVSDDGGATFQQNRVSLPRPDGNIQDYSAELWVTRHYIFAQIGYFSKGHSDATAQTQRLWRSEDNGRDWNQADTGLNAYAAYAVTMLQHDTTWLTHVVTSQDQGIWLTQDAGDHWRRVDPAPGGAFIYGNIYPPNRNQFWYNLSGEQAIHARVWQSVDGLNWAQIPRIPAYDGLAQAAPNTTRVIALTLDGKLLALGGSPTPNGAQSLPAPTEVSQAAQWVWIWDSQQYRWTPSGDGNLIFTAACDLCPGVAITSATGPDDSPGTYVWLYDYSLLDEQGQPLAPPRILREFVPVQ